LNKTANLYRPLRTSVDLSGDAVKITRVAPPPDLANTVMDFWQYEVDRTLDYIPIQVFPSGCVAIRFNIRPDHVESVLYGPSLRNNMKGLFYHDWAIFGLSLYPDRAYSLLGLSLHELRDVRISLECFWPARIRQLTEQLGYTENFNTRIVAMTQFLRDVIRKDVQPKADFLNAFTDIVDRAPHAQDIGYIAKRHGASGRTLRRHFSKYLGIGPKQMDRLVRVQQSMRAIHAAPNQALVQLAQQQGFSDQPHLSREFRTITGYSPAKFASLVGVMHDKSLPAWANLSTEWRTKRSPKIMRFR